MNSRHPHPRRVWKGGSEPQSPPPLPADPDDPDDPRDSRENSGGTPQVQLETHELGLKGPHRNAWLVTIYV